MLKGETETQEFLDATRRLLEKLGDAPERIEAELARLRAQRERNYCRRCGAFLATSGTPLSCWRCRTGGRR